ncbi:MAG: class I SAM-dependent methyltransferase, partial [Planctomycetota bacterium]
DQLSSSRKFGCVITNPPYGQRIGGPDEMAALYQSIPLVLRRLPTWSHFILTAYEGFEQIVGREATRRRKLYNGRIECQYYQFHGPLPDKSASSPPIFGGLAPEAKRQADEFRNRLQKRARHLRRWPARGITCYRLYERDIPEVPLVVDRYEDWLHISEFDRPHDRSPASHADWLDLMKRTAAESLGVPVNQVVLKQRQRQRGEQQYQRLAETADHLIAHEGGLQFSINLKDYLDTGLFLDHRKTRSMVRELASATRFLNLFAYTGSFSVYAADGGARETVSVDASRAYLDWAGENFRLNDMPLDHHHFVCADVLDYLRDLPPDQKFDLVVADPPTFSNSKTRATDWDVQKHHVPLLQAIRSHLAPDATLFFSTNFRRFKLDPDATEGLSVHEISKQTVPDDFRNRRIHRCWKMRPEGAPCANPSL